MLAGGGYSAGWRWRACWRIFPTSRKTPSGRKFAREMVENPDQWAAAYQMERPSRIQGAHTFLQRFDPYCYLLHHAGDVIFDLARDYGEGDLTRVLARVQAEMLFIQPPPTGCFPPSGQGRGPAETLRQLGKREPPRVTR